jgi:hypothetical protein
MSGRARLIRRIDNLINADITPATAYPLRARLARIVAEADRLMRTDEISTLPVDFISIVRRLRTISDQLMQPSEPFDGLWQAGWREVQLNVICLKSLLTSDAGRTTE